MKYTGTTFGRMSEDEIQLNAHGIIYKIHVITGWTIPATDEKLNIIVEQFEKKLTESYSKVTAAEMEYAFRNRGVDIKDWGKELNLTMIDDVMIPYLAQRFELSKIEESQSHKNQLMLEEKKELTDDEWSEWLNDMRSYDFKLIPCDAYDYLVKKGLINLSVSQKHEYMEKSIAYMVNKLEAGTKEMLDFLVMKSRGIYSVETTSSLVTISKRMAVRDYLNPPTNVDT